MWSKFFILSVLLMAMHLASSLANSLENTDGENVWVFESEKYVGNDLQNKQPQIVCYGWYCKRVKNMAAICKSKNFLVGYSCRIINLDSTYKLSGYSLYCKNVREPTNDSCWLKVTVEDAY